MNNFNERGRKTNTNSDNDEAQQDAQLTKSLCMSFADWKKTNANLNSEKSLEKPKDTPTLKMQQARRDLPICNNVRRNSRKLNCAAPPSNNFNKYNNFNGNNHSNYNNGKYAQPPSNFWEDMMSPLRQQPMQRPLLNWSSHVPGKVPAYHNSRTSKPHVRARQSEQKFSTEKLQAICSEVRSATALMPPPLPQPSVPNIQHSTPPVCTTKQVTGNTPRLTKGHLYIRKPAPPPPIDDKDPGTKEERQRQWKQYRQAMKPFKNRDFHNAKRCIQRLSKIPTERLEERQLERLQKSLEYVATHKAMLTVKHAERWVPKEDPDVDASNRGTRAQIYVRKPISSFWDKHSPPHFVPNTFRKYAPVKQYIGTGRAIKGGAAAHLMPKVFNQTKPKLANPMTLSYGHDSAYKDYYNAGVPPSTSNSQFFCPGYGTHFMKNESIPPNT